VFAVHKKNRAIFCSKPKAGTDGFDIEHGKTKCSSSQYKWNTRYEVGTVSIKEEQMVPIINQEYLKLHTRKLVTGIEQNVAKFLHQRNILLPNFTTRQKKICFKGDIFI
jgi:hypothetical protein